MPFHRRRQENEPEAPTPSAAPATPAPATPVPTVPLLNEPPQSNAPAESPVESQFQPVEGADEMLDMPLGTLIFRAGLIAPQQLEDALAEGLRSGKRLGEVLLSRGWLSEEDLSRLLAGQKGMPYADLDKIAVDRELAKAMSYDDARAEMALPVVTEFGLPVVAMADPDESAMERLRAQLGPEIRFVVAAPSVLTRLIDEVLGGAPAPGLVMAPSAEDQFAENDAPVESVAVEQPVAVEPVAEEQYAAPEPIAEEQPAAVEPVAEEQYAAAAPVDEPVVEAAPAELEQAEPEPAEPDSSLQEIQPIIAEGEIAYPTFSEFQPIPEIESIQGPDELLPAEVQAGDFGYYDDPSLLEGNAWQAGETGPPSVESADQVEAAYEVEQPEVEAEQPVEETEPLAEEAEPPVEEAEPLVEEVVQEPAEEPYVEAAPEPVMPTAEELAPEQTPELPEEVGEEPRDEDLVSTTPAWMQGEVNMITADVVDFIDSGGPAEEVAQPLSAESDELTEPEPEQIVEETVEAPIAEAEADEPATEPLVEAAGWSDEPAEASEQIPAEEVEEAPVEPAAVPVEVRQDAESGESQFELVLRLVDGDRMSIGMFVNVEGAQEKAAEVVKQFADVKEGSWPFIGGRFLRPDTIVSIDVEEHGTGWGGSNSRGRMFSGEGE